MKCRINDKRCRDAVANPPKKTTLLWDDADDGFVFRVTPAGAGAFVYVYRIDGRQHKFTIARHGQVTARKARSMYRELRSKVVEGKDPARKRAEDLAAPTVAHMLDLFWTAQSGGWADKTKTNYANFATAVRANFGGWKVQDMRKADVEVWHKSMVKTPANANLCKRYLGSVMAYAVALEHINRNPVAGIKEFDQEDRSSYLDPDQWREVMREFWQDHHREAAAMLAFMSLTGCRKNEAQLMDFDQVKNDANGAIWIKPRHHTKQRKEHVVALSGSALDIVERQRLLHVDGQVFRRPEGRDGPLDPKSTWQRIRRNLGLNQIRVHDLRHSFASLLLSQSNGTIGLAEIGQLLGHSKPSTTLRYAKLHVEAQRERVGLVETILLGGD